MPDAPQRDFSTVELDPDLLSTPFQVPTNWHVITGAPSSGKSTLIDRLAERGFQTVPETARLYIAGEKAKGRTMEQIREPRPAMQRGITAMQVDVEDGLPPDELLFLDGAVPTSLAWSRAFDMNPNEILPHCYYHRYASVFLLDPLPFQDDGERDQDAAIVDFLDRWLDRDYQALGYRVVRVPVLAPLERQAFVLERLSARGRV